MNSNYTAASLISFVCILFSSCILNTDRLDSWIGVYRYEEPPVKSIAGYSMVMNWSLKIIDTNNQVKGFLEVDGQQTSMEINTNVAGNTNEIAIIYAKAEDGINADLKSGDTLFFLKKENNNVITIWKSLKPILSETTTSKCTCFQR